MFISLEQKIVTNQDNLQFFQTDPVKKSATDSTECIKVNYLRMLHQCGIGSADSVLIIGVPDIEMLHKLSNLVGLRGSITVVHNDLVELADLQVAAEAGEFKAYKPFTGGHPAFDGRAESAKYAPVQVTVEHLPFGDLPFADNRFDIVWIERPLGGLTGDESRKLAAELERVTKRK